MFHPNFQEYDIDYSKIKRIITLNINNNKIGKNKQQIIKCKHFENNYSCLFPCCDRYFGCFICHNNVIKNHKANITDFLKINEVICNNCKKTNNLKSNKCTNCDKQLKEYNYSRNIRFYKGVYRVCEKMFDSYCEKCDEIIYREIDHICNKNLNICIMCYYNNNQEKMMKLLCGHYVHMNCIDKINYYACHECNKTAYLDNKLIDAYDEIYKSLVKHNELIVDVCCYDCEKVTIDKYNDLGLYKCEECSSYNTFGKNKRKK